MIVYLSAAQLLDLQRRLIERFGGRAGIRDRCRLEAAAARPAATFDGEDLHPDLVAKAAALFHGLSTATPSWTATRGLARPQPSSSC